MSAKKDLKSGRVSYDDRGQPVWEWRVDTGTFSSEIDTQQLRQIEEEAAVTLKDEAAPHAVGFDPYSTSVSTEPKKAPRRTLDDMRKLSEEIKRKRQQQK
jgi:hypothetical protein